MDAPVAVTAREIQLEEHFLLWVGKPEHSRIYASFALEHGIGTTELVRHAQKFFWKQRTAELAQRVTDAALLNDEGMMDVKKRQLNALRKLLAKAILAMDNIVFDKPSDIIRAIDMCVKHEREILGMTASNDMMKLAEVLRERFVQVSGDAPQQGLLPEPDYAFDVEDVVEPEPLDDPPEDTA